MKSFDQLIKPVFQNPQSQPPTASACTESSPTPPNATCSGTAGTERLPATSAAPDSPTTGNPVSACGLTRSLSAGTRVRFSSLKQQVPIQVSGEFNKVKDDLKQIKCEGSKVCETSFLDIRKI